MRRLRILLSLLLGLSLMTQGMAVAVAAVGSSPAAMSSTMAGMDMSADDHDMPCMDMDGMSDQAMPKCPSNCCDGKVCLDMSTCAQAQPAISAYRAPTFFANVEHHAPTASALIATERPPTSLLRPPISSHV